MKSFGRFTLFASWILATMAAPAQSALEQAAQLYRQTAYQQAAALLEASTPKTAPAWFLLGQCYYGMGEYQKATDALEQAAAAEPTNSVYFNWLGKAFGRRAETAHLFAAPGLARRAKERFERAVELDRANREAISDLFEYYLAAPGFLGGGRAKAAALAETMAALDAAQYRYFQARLAEKDGKFELVERNLREAVELAPRQVGRVLDLARFLARRGRAKESDQLFGKAESLSPGAPQIKFAKAQAYVQAKRNLPEARLLLEEYLASPLTPDDPPRSDAQRLLKAASGG